MDKHDLKQIEEVVKGNNDRSEWGDICEVCNVEIPFSQIGFRGICFDCKPPVTFKKNILDEIYEKLLKENND